MPESLVQEKETTLTQRFIGSYRDFLDADNPVAVKNSKLFYNQVDWVHDTKYSDRLKECRTRAWFLRNSVTGRVRVATNQCRLRWCYHCSKSRQQFITQAILPWLEKAKEPKLLTLTLRHTQKPLPEQIDYLYSSFVKLRSRNYVKKRIRGGVWFFQITYNKSKQEWHPHLHCLLDADYMAHCTLKSYWSEITDGSEIIHIRTIYDRDKTLSHNARYAARPSTLEKIPVLLWPQLFTAFKNRRMVGTWGGARSISLRPQKPMDAEEWKKIGNFTTVRELLTSSEDARQIWDAWLKDSILPDGIDVMSEENFLDGKYDEPPPREKKYIEPIFNFGFSKEQY